LSLVDLGIVKIEAGADVQTVQRRLQEILPTDLAVHIKDEFIQREISFWATSTPIGYIFMTGTVMGFIVGVVICYQVIYSGLADYMSEFATLKAMGYRDRYFLGLVLQTALYLSIASYVPGLLLSAILYKGLAEFTGLLMIMNLARAGLVFVLTLTMCVVSGCLAVRKVLAADPADLF
jgi:putative ABC transport system permease protein